MAEDEEEDGEANGGDKRDGGVYDDDLFSLITVLNLGRCGDNRCIKEYVLVVCGHKDTKKTLRTTVASRSITVLGLLLRKMESEASIDFLRGKWMLLVDSIDYHSIN